MNSGDTIHVVGGKQANRFGLFDMLGNVFEWVQDDYYPYQNESVTDPLVIKGSNRKVFRGGAYGSTGFARVSFHYSLEPMIGAPNIGMSGAKDLGFRCVGEFR